MIVAAIVVVLLAQAGLRPNPSMPPEAVIQSVVLALRSPNTPQPNAGVFMAYQFASPANKTFTAPYGRFLRLVKQPDFVPLYKSATIQFGKLERDGDFAQQIVRVQGDDGREIAYRIAVSRQSNGTCFGCWMVDGVEPVSR